MWCDVIWNVMRWDWMWCDVNWRDVLRISSDGNNREGFSWIWNCRFRDFFGWKIWQVVFLVAWFKERFFRVFKTIWKIRSSSREELLYYDYHWDAEKITSDSMMSINKHKHSISNVFIFHVISFNALWKFLRLENSAWEFFWIFGPRICFGFWFLLAFDHSSWKPT